VQEGRHGPLMAELGARAGLYLASGSELFEWDQALVRETLLERGFRSRSSSGMELWVVYTAWFTFLHTLTASVYAARLRILSPHRTTRRAGVHRRPRRPLQPPRRQQGRSRW
jgi:hypothetical protein